MASLPDLGSVWTKEQWRATQAPAGQALGYEADPLAGFCSQSYLSYCTTCTVDRGHGLLCTCQPQHWGSGGNGCPGSISIGRERRPSDVCCRPRVQRALGTPRLSPRSPHPLQVPEYLAIPGSIQGALPYA